ncbi:Acg family FMN-binding oxidoreductase [Saccharopolyspora sp. 5N102]|uniref:Acg family FMN-binding oxidoreductase n=1 Tax=Saccharopolyspora sp. 5N102 TaxID=3375155 RepID=UPI0037A7DF9A
MSWPPMLHRQPPESADERPWTPEEVAVLAEAVRRAPSVHNTQPWSLRVQGRAAVLRLRSTPELAHHDPDGRDRRMSCGAAVANLAIAMRGLGWATDVHWHADDGEAAVIGTHRRPATAIDRERRRAIGRRASFRRAFTGRPVPHLARTAVAAAATTQATWVDGPAEEHALARLLAYAARTNHADKTYQRELGAWIGPVSDEGLPAEVLPTRGVPATGLATGATRLPDQEQIARSLARESVLVFSTITDGPRDQLMAGEAAERAWLEATRLGLVASVMTQPLRLSEVRARLSVELGLGGMPQLLMRIGYPPAIPVPRAGRRPLPDLFAD